MNYPKISIGLPTYNRSNGLEEALTSIWAQNYPNLEILISDNCSTDDTQLLCETLVNTDCRVTYYRQPKNIGMVANFEFVLSKATGKYFMWVSDDDRLEPGVLLKYVSFLEKNPAYSLVSGEIKYLLDNDHDLYERGFTLEQKSSSLRVMSYYSKVIYGGLIHGLMRCDLAQSVRLRKVIGNDYHFIANLAYLGEIKHLSFVGYHKKLGGTSKDFHNYALHIGDTNFAANYPHLKMACDAFSEVMYRSSIYAQMPVPSRLILATSSFLGVVLRYYGGIFPFIIGGKIIRFVKKPVVYLKKNNTSQPVPANQVKAEPNSDYHVPTRIL